MGVIVFLILAAFAVVALVGVMGLFFGLLGLAFKLLPVVIVGYVVVKVIQHLERPRGAAMTTTARDSGWLDTRD